MGASQSDLSGQHVVIVGGSFAGVNTARQCEKAGLKVTVIEPKDCMHINFASLRATVAPGFEKQTMVPLDRVFKPANVASGRCRFVRGLAAGVDPSSKTVSYIPIDPTTGTATGDKKSIAYDFLVIATGSQYSEPFKLSSYNRSAALKSFTSLQAAVAPCKKFLVVGGGASGIELVGELKAAFPSASVTLVHSGAHLLSGYEGGEKHGFPAVFTTRIKTTLESQGVKVILGARATKPTEKGAGQTFIGNNLIIGPGKVALSNGAVVDCDAQFWTTGPRPNTDWLKGGALEKSLNAAGRVNVELTYQVKGTALDTSSIFCLGDACASLDSKAAWVLTVGGLAKLVADNVACLAKAKVTGRQVKQLKQGKPEGLGGMSFLTLGPKAGLGLTPIGMMSSMVVKLKSKALMTDKAVPEFGYSLPELIALNSK